MCGDVSSGRDIRRAKQMIPVVEKVARTVARKLPRHVPLDDLLGAGNLGLADAIRKLSDNDDDTHFEAYAVTRIRGEIYQELRRGDSLTRDQRALVRQAERGERKLGDRATECTDAEIAEAAGMSVKKYRSSRVLRHASCRVAIDSLYGNIEEGKPASDDILERKQLLNTVEREVVRLPDRLRLAVSTFYRDATLAEIGSELGVSEGRACQLRQQAVTKLRRRLAQQDWNVAA